MTSRPSNAPLVLIIRDGWGENPNPEHAAFNAIALADTPVDDQLRRDWPHTLITTCGEAVGLPAGTMGNSEVGHQNIGAGRIVDQEIMRITRAIRDGRFFENAALLGAFDHARATGGAVHLMGLVSDGKVHSDIEHLFALIDLAVRMKFSGNRVFVHVFTDGRDVGPTTGLGFIQKLQDRLAELHCGRIASITGRYYAMDRDHRWERTARAYAALTGQGRIPSGAPARVWTACDPIHVVKSWYAQKHQPNMVGDEFIEPTQIVEHEVPVGLIESGDSVVFFNFRGDRPRQITRAFTLDDEDWANVQGGGFDRGERINNLYFCTMSGYEQGLPVTAIAFEKPQKMPRVLGQVIADAGLAQFRCAETEKFAHVTFFFNDYREQPFPGEQRELIPSPQDVATYDQKPQMSAEGVCSAVLQQLASDTPPALFVVNFANPDMVGHTGNLDAVIKAVQTVDACVGRIIDATLAVGGCLIITADHGNAEQMYDPIHQSPHTAHTTFDVPLYIVGKPFKHAQLRNDGILGDIAPTALHMLGITQPQEMTGRSLLK